MNYVRAVALLVCHSALAFDYEALKQLIEEKQFTRIEQVVQALPAEFHTNYTLMRASRSLQDASPTAPRVISFNHDGTLILAWNGYSAQKGYDALELIQFRPNKKFEFRSIQFPEDAGGKGNPVFSGANPPNCVACHGSRVRPNWERYPEWPGAFGSLDDFPQTEELSQLQAFVGKQMKAGRYRALKTLPGSVATPYETQMRGRLRFRPNFRLAALTFAHQADALNARLRTASSFPKARFLFAMSRLNCKTTIDIAKELERLYGKGAADPLPPLAAPNVLNLHAYVLHNIGMSDKNFTTQLLVNDDPKMGPYFFHCGLPKDITGGVGGAGGYLGIDGVIELTDLVMSRMVRDMLTEIPDLAPYFTYARWLDFRFAADPLDKPQASQIDDVVGIYNHKKLMDACPVLEREYSKL